MFEAITNVLRGDAGIRYALVFGSAARSTAHANGDSLSLTFLRGLLVGVSD